MALNPDRVCEKLFYQRKAGNIDRPTYVGEINALYSQLRGRDKGWVDNRISWMHDNFLIKDAGHLAMSYYDNSLRENYLVRTLWGARHGIVLLDNGIDNSGMFHVRMKKKSLADFIAVMPHREVPVEVKFTTGDLTLRVDHLESYINQGAGILLFRSKAGMVGPNGDPYKPEIWRVDTSQLWCGWAPVRSLEQMLRQEKPGFHKNQRGALSVELKYDRQFEKYFKLKQW